MVRSPQQAQVEDDHKGEYIENKEKANQIITRINQQSTEALTHHLNLAEKERVEEDGQPRVHSKGDNG